MKYKYKLIEPENWYSYLKVEISFGLLIVRNRYAPTQIYVSSTGREFLTMDQLP